MPETESTVQSDFAPFFNLYVQAMEGWKQNYETFAKLASAPGAANKASASAFGQKPWGAWRELLRASFRRYVEVQIELCRFYESRWRDYLRLAEMLAASRSPSDVEASEASFVKQAMTDYANESRKLMQSFAELAMTPANAQWNAACRRAG